MFNRDYAALVLDTIGGEVEGRTKLQNLIFIASIQTDDYKSLTYHMGYYSPCSNYIHRGLELLEMASAITSKHTPKDSVEDDDFELTKWEYKLTDCGIEFVTRLRSESKYSDTVNALDNNKELLIELAGKEYKSLAALTKEIFLFMEKTQINISIRNI